MTLRLSLNKVARYQIEVFMLCDQMEPLDERELTFQLVLVPN